MNSISHPINIQIIRIKKQKSLQRKNIPKLPHSLKINIWSKLIDLSLFSLLVGKKSQSSGFTPKQLLKRNKQKGNVTFLTWKMECLLLRFFYVWSLGVLKMLKWFGKTTKYRTKTLLIYFSTLYSLPLKRKQNPTITSRKSIVANLHLCSSFSFPILTQSQIGDNSSVPG